METKYYIPSIEEFYAGFEYEINNILQINDDLIQDNWEKCICTQGFGAFDNDIWDLKEERIRVKYIDKKDIERLGWKLIKEYKEQLTFEFIISETYRYVMIFDSDTFDITNVYISKEFISFTDHYYKDIFEGLIKNSSELKKLMKQLNIN